MIKDKPDKVRLTIKTEERLSPDMVGIELGVKVLDQSSKPVSGQPFKVHADAEVLIEGITDERGEFSGQRVLTVQEGMQRKVFLVLDDSAATDWKVVGEKKEEQPEPQTMEINVKVLDATGKPLDGYPFKIQVESDGPVDAKTDEKGEYSKKTVLDTQQGTQQKVSLVLKVATVLPKEKAEPSEVLKEILSGKRAIKSGETYKLKKETYEVTGDIRIEKGACLEIEPGSVLKMNENGGIICEGGLMAVGKVTDPIVFQAQTDGKHWRNITFADSGAHSSTLEFCIVENGGGRRIFDKKNEAPKQEGDYILGERDTAAARWEGVYLGGGVLCLGVEKGLVKDKKVTLKDSIIRGCKSTHGGGLCCLQSSPDVGKLEVAFNSAVLGGGVSIIDAKGTLRSIHVHNNVGGHRGAGVAIWGSEVVVQGGKIEANMLTLDSGSAHEVMGAGIYIDDSRMELHSTIVAKNGLSLKESDDTSLVIVRGGGVAAWDSELSISGSEISGYKSAIPRELREEGGGVYAWNSKLNIDNSEVYDNCVDGFNSSGGGISVDNCDDPGLEVILTNTKIRRNRAGGNGGGISISDPRRCKLQQVQIEENTGYRGAALDVDGEIANFEIDGLTIRGNENKTKERTPVVRDSNHIVKDAVVRGKCKFGKNTPDLPLIDERLFSVWMAYVDLPEPKPSWEKVEASLAQTNPVNGKAFIECLASMVKIWNYANNREHKYGMWIEGYQLKIADVYSEFGLKEVTYMEGRGILPAAGGKTLMTEKECEKAPVQHGPDGVNGIHTWIESGANPGENKKFAVKSWGWEFRASADRYAKGGARGILRIPLIG